MCLFACFSFTKLHLLMRLRWGPSPASCSVSGIRLPACRHACTPGITQRGWGGMRVGGGEGLKLQLIMLTWKSARRQLQWGDDKTHVCLITMRWKIGKAAVVDRESYPQSDGVNDATPVLSVSSLSRNWASPFNSLGLLRFHSVT